MLLGKFFAVSAILTVSYEEIRPEDDVQVTFSCTGRQGALLSLPFPAQREDTAALRDFGKCIVKNIDAWFAYAEDLGLGIDRMEDIILVTGCHRARSWVIATFSESQAGAQVSFGAEVVGNSGVDLEWRDARGGDLKLGPTGRVRIYTVLCLQHNLRDLGISVTRTYQRTNACLSEGSVSSAF